MTGTAVATHDEGAHFGILQRKAAAFANSTLVPEHMRESIGNCTVALLLAEEMRENPLVVMQNMHLIKGRPGWMTQYMISRANRSGKFQGPIRWNVINQGTEDLAVFAYADLRDVHGDPRVESPAISLKDAIAAGWTTYRDKLTKKIETHDRWNTPAMQEQMLRWRSAAWLIRLYVPEVMFGLPTVDELQDISRDEVDITPPPAPDRGQFETRRPTVTDVEEPQEQEEQGDDRGQADGGAAVAAGSAEDSGADGESGGSDPAAVERTDDRRERIADNQSGAQDRRVSDAGADADEPSAARAPASPVQYPVLRQKVGGRGYDWDAFGREFIAHVSTIEDVEKIRALRTQMNIDRTLGGVKLNNRTLWQDMQQALGARQEQLSN